MSNALSNNVFSSCSINPIETYGCNVDGGFQRLADWENPGAAWTMKHGYYLVLLWIIGYLDAVIFY
jgi:hypothetical protein